MFGLDDWISGLSEGASIGVVLFVAILLGFAMRQTRITSPR